MPDDQIEYVDENGNVIDPSELGDDVEIVEEYVDDEVDEAGFDADEIGFNGADEVPDADVEYAEPVSRPAPVPVDDEVDLDDVVVDDAPPTPVPSMADATAFAERVEPVESAPPAVPTLNRRSKLVLLGGAVAVVAVIGGGAAFAAHSIGSQSTIADVKAGASSKYAQASSSVVAKSSEVRGDAESVVIDACKGSLSAAMASGSRDAKLKLDVISAVPLPSGFIAATAPNADGQAGKTSLLQLTKTSWGVYTTTPLTRAERKQEVTRPGFHKADVTVTDTAITVTGDRVWAGGDEGGAGSCAPGEPGVYAASGRVPADAAGLVDGQASVTAIQGIAGEPAKAVAVMGDSVALVDLVEAEPEGGEASSSSSAVPSK